MPNVNEAARALLSSADSVLTDDADLRGALRFAHDAETSGEDWLAATLALAYLNRLRVEVQRSTLDDMDRLASQFAESADDLREARRLVQQNFVMASRRTA